MLSGVPGSGKSYFSAALRKHKGSHVYIVSSDALRNVMLGNQQDLSEDRLMWKMYYKLAYVYATDPRGVVVLDATHSNSTYRIEATKFLKPLFDEVNLVIFNLPRHIVNQQNMERPFPVPEDVLDILCSKFELPDEKDQRYFNKIFVVTDHDIMPIIEQL